MLPRQSAYAFLKHLTIMLSNVENGYPTATNLLRAKGKGVETLERFISDRWFSFTIGRRD